MKRTNSKLGFLAYVESLVFSGPAAILGASLVASCSPADAGMGKEHHRSELTMAGLEGTLTVTSVWDAGYCANLKVRNRTSSPSTWTATVSLGTGKITQSWNVIASAANASAVFRGVAWNATLAAGAAADFGYCASGTAKPSLTALSGVGGGGSGGGTGGTGGSASGGTGGAASGTGGGASGGTASGGTGAGGATSCGSSVSPTSVSNPDIDVTLDLTGAPHRRLPADFQGINTAAWSAIPKNQEAIPVVKRSGIRALRYPGGGMADEYQWDLNNWYPGSEPGDLTSPEHLKSFGDGVSASALITVNVRTRDADYAAGWVADAKKKGNAWKLWEVGNEYDLAGITEDEYVTRFNEYAAKMKRADPNIMVGGPVGTNAYFWEYPDGRLAQFMKGCGNRLGSGQVDFVSLHWYPGGPEDPNTAEILAAPQDWERNLNQINAIVARYDNRKLPVYITEWNAVPYGPGVFTISVANALFTADLLAEFARTGLAGSFFWDIENGSPEVGSDGTKGTYGYLDPSGLAPYPSYYAHWMFSRLGSAFYVPNQNVARDSVASIWAGKRGDGTLAILAINKTASAKKVRVSLRGFCPEGQARRYVLSGTSALDTKPTLNGITMPKDVSAVPAQLVSVGTVFGTELPPWSASLVELPAK